MWIIQFPTSTRTPTNRQVIRTIEAGLTEFNETKCPDPTPDPLTLSVQDEDGQVIGGLLDNNAYGWMRVGWVWIDERHRGKGLGTALLARAEEVAVRRGCHGLHLDAHSFQAPQFYLRLGYEPFGELDGYPGENKRIYLRKRLISKQR